MIRETVSDPVGAVSHRWDMLMKNLFNSSDFYDQYVGGSRLRWEIVTLLLIGVIGGVGYLFAVQTILEEFLVGAPGAQFRDLDQPVVDRTTQYQLYGHIFHPIVGMFILWFYYTTAFFVGSWLYTGGGRYYTLLKNTAWALTPYLISNLLGTVAFVITFWQIDIETVLTGVPDTNVPYLLYPGLTEPLMIIATVVTVGVIGWVGYLGIHAMQNCQNLTRDQAVKVVIAPVVLHAGYVVWQLLTRLSIV